MIDDKTLAEIEARLKALPYDNAVAEAWALMTIVRSLREQLEAANRLRQDWSDRASQDQQLLEEANAKILDMVPRSCYEVTCDQYNEAERLRKEQFAKAQDAYRDKEKAEQALEAEFKAREEVLESLGKIGQAHGKTVIRAEAAEKSLSEAREREAKLIDILELDKNLEDFSCSHSKPEMSCNCVEVERRLSESYHRQRDAALTPAPPEPKEKAS